MKGRVYLQLVRSWGSGQHLDRKRDRLGEWMNALEARMHPNKAIVAVAAKIARIAWVIITKPGALYDRRDPSFA